MTGAETRDELSERVFFAPLPVADAPAVALPAAIPEPQRRPFFLSPSTEAISRLRWRYAARRLTAAITLEQERGVAFLLAPPVMILGVFAYLALSVEPPVIAFGVVAALLALLVWVVRDAPGWRLLLTGMLVFVLGAACTSLETWRASTKMLGAEITTRVTARVVEIDHLATGRIRLTADILSTERPQLRFAPDRVRISASSIPDGLVAGSVVTGAARLFPPSGPLRPHSYDFSFESYFDGIGANGFFFAKPQLLSAAVDTSSLSGKLRDSVDNFRNRVAAHVRGAIGGPEGEIAAALIVGARAGIPEPVNEALRRTGLAHILSISGLHMALVAASIMGGMRLAFAFFPGFASRWPVKKFSAVIALVAVGAYLLVSGAEVAAQRSFIMLAVMLIAVMFDRAALTMRNLAIATLVVLAVSPHEVAGPSFQMSFAATAALIGGYAVWSERREGKVTPAHSSLIGLMFSKAGKLVAGIIITALIAGLATTIYGVWHFHRVSPLSLVANLAVTPIISVVMWAAVFAAAAMPFGLDGPLLAIMGQGLSWMLAVADWLSARSPVDAVGMIPVGSVIVMTAALLVATLATTWLRLLALPLAALGFVLLAERPLPDLLVSEDGRLVALRTADGNLAVNRSRPNGFTVDDWRRAVIASEIATPATKDKPAADQGSRFSCADGICTIRHATGATILYAEKAQAVAANCDAAAIIIVADPTLRRNCGSGRALVLGARELAQRGTAALTISKVEDGFAIRTEFAVRRPYRPWHEHRQFSRTARGVAPYQSGSGKADDNP